LKDMLIYPAVVSRVIQGIEININMSGFVYNLR
jgi:hypothetical protein